MRMCPWIMAIVVMCCATSCGKPASGVESAVDEPFEASQEVSKEVPMPIDAPADNDVDDEDSWERLWNARQAALEGVLGSAEDMVYHSPVPFYLDGNADVLVFKKHLDGVAYVTADIVGDDRAKPNANGQYELMICLREDATWAPNLISRLAPYTVETVLNPGETMDIGEALPQPTAIEAFVFVDYARFTVDGEDAGILLCIGITAEELRFAMRHRSAALIARLKEAGVYPFTDLERQSIPLDR